MRIRRVGIVTRHRSERVRQVGLELAKWLERRDVQADLNRIDAGMDMVIILGGDGTLLHVAARASELELPVVGINLGNLGFLTEVAADEMHQALEMILAGEGHIERRLMLKATLWRPGSRASDPLFALNEVVVLKSSTGPVLRLHCWADEEYISTYKADGLIFSTPTGSTAYNLSAGGPIVQAELDTLIVTPICPFMLESRPVLLSSRVRIRTRLAERADNVRVMVDGRPGWDLEEGVGLQVEAAGKPLLLVSSPHKGYFAILRNKLNWGGSQAGVPLDPVFTP